MAKIKLRRDTYTNWYNANPILGLGEPSFDTTNKAFKVGDGLTVWRNLSYTSGVDTTKLPLSGGTLTGGLTGTNAVFASVSATRFYGDGSSLTNLTIGSFLASSGGTLTGGLTGTTAKFNSISAVAFQGDGSQLTGIVSSGGNGTGDTIVGNGTIRLVPNNTLSAIAIGQNEAFGTGGQYLIIDPTAPADIHIRAGGPIDQAAASLILGGEKANVTVRDQANNFTEKHHVLINTKSNNSNSYTWTFDNNGDLLLPDNGGIVFDRNNTTIRVGQGFYIASGEGISLQAIDATDAQNLIYKNWTFGTDGKATFAGSFVAAVSGVNSGTNEGSVAIDITKQVNILEPMGSTGTPVGYQYTLADGSEGQILYLVPSGTYGNGDEYTTVKINHARYRNITNGNIIEQTNAVGWLPFGGSLTSDDAKIGSYNALVTLIFTEGHWNLPHSIFD